MDNVLNLKFDNKRNHSKNKSNNTELVLQNIIDYIAHESERENK